MKVTPVWRYNILKSLQYDTDCKSWDYKNGGFPQIAFYLFFNQDGSERKTGYVAYGDNKAVWRETKKEAIEAFNS